MTTTGLGAKFSFLMVLLIGLMVFPKPSSALWISSGDTLHAGGISYSDTGETFATPIGNTITAFILSEQGTFQTTNTFGIYGYTIAPDGTTVLGNTLELFNGPDTTGASVTLDFDPVTKEITATSPTIGSPVYMGPQLGFYLDSSSQARGGTFYSQPELSTDFADHFNFYATGGSSSVNGADLVLGMEDLSNNYWDSSYNDMVVGFTGVDPVPEPGTLLLFGSGLASLGFYFRRRRI